MENLNMHKANPQVWTAYPLRVLVIDDEPFWQSILSHSLHKYGPADLQIRFVRSAKQALDLIFREKKFDLIISDHFIQGEMTGYELWSHCKSQFLNIPFILISGKRKEEFNDLKTDGGPNLPLIIQKPFDVKNFRTIINLYLSK